MKKFLSVCLVGLLLAGCAQFAPKAFDPVTLSEIDQTIDYETKDYDASKKALLVLGAPQIVLTELEIRHDSEIARLKAWKVSEEAKKIPGEDK
jgi:hypothetical protein